MIFQEPMTSLNPAFTIGDQLTEVVLRHRGVTAAQARERALEVMRQVRIPPRRRASTATPTRCPAACASA